MEGDEIDFSGIDEVGRTLIRYLQSEDTRSGVRCPVSSRVERVCSFIPTCCTRVTFAGVLCPSRVSRCTRTSSTHVPQRTYCLDTAVVRLSNTEYSFAPPQRQHYLAALAVLYVPNDQDRNSVEAHTVLQSDVACGNC